MNNNLNNIETVSFLTIPGQTVKHNDIPGHIGQDMVTVKGLIYYRDMPKPNPSFPGESYRQYLTVIVLVPAIEFNKNISFGHHPADEGHPLTKGVFVKVIGSTKGIITTNNRVYLTNYTNHLENIGWKYLSTVGNKGGCAYEQLRQWAWQTICKHRNKYPVNR